MKEKEIDNEKMKETRLAVQRLMENRGGMKLNKITEVFSSSQEINGLIHAIIDGSIIRSGERIWLHPEICYAVMREGAME